MWLMKIARLVVISFLTTASGRLVGWPLNDNPLENVTGIGVSFLHNVGAHLLVGDQPNEPFAHQLPGQPAAPQQTAAVDNSKRQKAEVKINTHPLPLESAAPQAKLGNRITISGFMGNTPKDTRVDVIEAFIKKLGTADNYKGIHVFAKDRVGKDAIIEFDSKDVASQFISDNIEEIKKFGYKDGEKRERKLYFNLNERKASKAERKVGHAETEKLVHTLPLQSASPQALKIPCPSTCNCQPGDAAHGGLGLVSGACLGFCSRMYDGVRYCGNTVHYRDSQSIDCRRCSEPANFGARYRVHQPHGEVRASLILLGPWNGSLGWGMDWFIDESNKSWGQPLVRKHYRIIEVVGKKMPGKPFTAWYNYANEGDWFQDRPIDPEVDLAVSYVHSLIEQESNIVGDYRRVVLVGLSQGACLAIESAMRFPQALGLVLSQRGAILPSRLKNTTSVASIGTPYILTAGEADHYYSAEVMRSTALHLQRVAGIGNVFMKTIPALDHYEWSEPEWLLSLKACAVALLQEPAISIRKKLAELTDWTISGYE